MRYNALVRRVTRLAVTATMTVTVAATLTVAPAHAQHSPPGGTEALAVTTTAAHTAAAGSQAAGTRMHRVRPVDARSHLKAGYTISRRVRGTCWTTSTFQRGAYRCMAHNFIHDPCWRLHTAARVRAVVCVTKPWQRHVVRIRIGRLPAAEPGHARIWGLSMRLGWRCVGSSGAHSVFHGRAVNYYCGGRWVLLGKPDRSKPLWRMHTARRINGHYRDTGVRYLSDAWFARPDAAA